MTQTPYDFPSPNNIHNNNSAAPGALCRPRMQIMALHAFGWDPNIRREELIKIDVERRAIVRPGPIDSPSWGIFYSPHLKRATFYPPRPENRPERTSVSTAVPAQDRRRAARLPRSVRGVFERVHDPELPSLPRPDHWLAEPSGRLAHSDASHIRERFSQRMPNVLIRAPVRITNQVSSEIDADLSTMKKRKFDAYGLHYVLMAPEHSTAKIVENICLRILLDTACPITWFYRSDTKTLLENKPDETKLQTNANSALALRYSKESSNVPRYSGARCYSGSAKQLSFSVEEVVFADKFAVWLKLSQGILRIMNFSTSPSAGLEPFVEFDDFKFGTCDAATEDKVTEQIDGMLGLSHKAVAFGRAEMSDLFVTKYTQESGLGGLKPLEPILTVALGDDYAEIPGWFIIDPEGKGDVPQDISESPKWSQWIKTPKTTLVQWIIYVKGLAVGFAPAQSLPTGKSSSANSYAFMIDTASLYTYLPEEMFNTILALLPAGATTENGEPYCCIKDDSALERLKRKIVTFFSDDGTPIPLGGLDMFVQDTGPDPHNTTERYCSFRRGVVRPGPREASPTDPQELYILGNLFLRQFVVQFQHKNNKENTGQVRLARRTTTE